MKITKESSELPGCMGCQIKLAEEFEIGSAQGSPSPAGLYWPFIHDGLTYELEIARNKSTQSETKDSKKVRYCFCQITIAYCPEVKETIDTCSTFPIELNITALKTHQPFYF